MSVEERLRDLLHTLQPWDEVVGCVFWGWCVDIWVSCKTLSTGSGVVCIVEGIGVEDVAILLRLPRLLFLEICVEGGSVEGELQEGELI